MVRGAWGAAVHGEQSQTPLSTHTVCLLFLHLLLLLAPLDLLLLSQLCFLVVPLSLCPYPSPSLLPSFSPLLSFFFPLSLFSLSFFTVLIVLDIIPVFVPLLVWKLKLYKHVHTYTCNILVFYTNICDYIQFYMHITHINTFAYIYTKRSLFM